MKNTKTIARLTGLGYLGIFITGFFANFYVLEGLVVEGNISQTAQNFETNPIQFHFGLISFFIMIILDIVLAYPLYRLLKEENIVWAKVSSSLRVINGLYFLYALSYLVDLACELHKHPFDIGNYIEGNLNGFQTHWAIGLIIFGLHLLVLGNLVRRSVKFPFLIGVFLSLAAIGYLLDSSAQLNLFEEESIKELFADLVVIAGTIGELSFTIFLLFRGVKKIKVSNG